MDISQIVVLTVGISLLVIFNVNWESVGLWWWSTMHKPSKPAKPEAPVVEKDADAQFLHIVNLWFQLRNEAEDYGLVKAITAIDKVFPLLNDKIEEAE